MAMVESLLEAHYHRALVDLFQTTFGLGRHGHLNLYKYSSRNECYVGFDQAFIRSQMSSADMLAHLRNSAVNNAYQLDDHFFGYFLQYKATDLMATKTRVRPAPFNTAPHYRIKLDTDINARTGFSQHGMLYHLSRNFGAFVYYACPMIFDREDFYRPADLDTLKLIEFDGNTLNYAAGTSHTVIFENINSQPYWCSLPTSGTSANAQKLANDLKKEIARVSPKKAKRNLLELMTTPLVPQDKHGSRRNMSPITLVDEPPSSFCILRISYR